jgi:hypothetical protein
VDGDRRGAAARFGAAREIAWGFDQLHLVARIRGPIAAGGSRWTVDRRDSLAPRRVGRSCRRHRVTMVVVVGLAMLVRRGWHRGAQTVPLGVAYLAWHRDCQRHL